MNYKEILEKQINELEDMQGKAENITDKIKIAETITQIATIADDMYSDTDLL